MALFIAQLCEDDLSSVTVFLFNGDLLADIRLLLINELIGKKFQFKLNSRTSLDTFVRTMEVRDRCSAALLGTNDDRASLI